MLIPHNGLDLVQKVAKVHLRGIHLDQIHVLGEAASPEERDNFVLLFLSLVNGLGQEIKVISSMENRFN